MLIDPLPHELYLEVSNRCNSRCETCVRTFATLEPLRDMTLAEFQAIVDQVPALTRAVLHGVGEPLLNVELPAMVAYLKARVRPPRVLFNSNAILLTDRTQLALIDAALDEFRISTDAARRELYARIRGVDAFDRMVDNVGAFAQRIRQMNRGPRLSFWFTAMRENLSDLPDLIRLAHHLGVAEVYVQRLVFNGLGLAQQQQSLYRALHAAEEALLQEAERVADEMQITLCASGTTSPRASLNSPDGDRKPWARCRRPQTLAYVTANGNVLPCCFSPFTTGDYPALVLGNAFQRPLREIWLGRAYQEFRIALQSDRPPEACERCGVCWSL
jgi:radical SAM protein with 4Fe4S-binding SPASM domain